MLALAAVAVEDVEDSPVISAGVSEVVSANRVGRITGGTLEEGGGEGDDMSTLRSCFLCSDFCFLSKRAASISALF